ERWRRRGEDDGEFAERAIDDGHVARVVGNAVLLLVCPLMLLIDDDEAELGPRQEQGRTRADDNLRRSVRYRAPGPLALARPHAGMPLRRFSAEAALVPLNELLG